jgi:peptidoglycan hydrolase-like protein with peptidoglycan-binding domain
MSLKKLGIYTGEADGQYDEEMAKIITAIQTNAKPTDTQIEINGKADLPTLNYIAKQITFLSGVVKSSIEGTVSPEEYQKRQQTQGYIQRMQSALADR